ncbi:MAG: glycosyltransferase family 39 protein [Anaerolineae bacterium]|nr:glycosyltransferase family 39 protein [Anaerolineae bacterium]
MHKWADKLIVPLLLLMFIQLMGTAPLTAREQESIVRGYVWLETGRSLAGASPLFSHVLAAWPVRMLSILEWPQDDPIRFDDDTGVVGHRLLWNGQTNVVQVLFLARLPNAALALLLSAFIYRWARELWGPTAGLLALLLSAFDPNLLAHARLATADLPVAAFTFIAVYWLWRLLRRPTVPHLFATGFFAGLAMASKFSALLFGPVLAALFIARALVDQPFQLSIRLPLVASVSGETRQGRLAWLVTSGLLIVLIAVLTVWVAYGFQVGELGGVRLLASDYWAQLLDAPNRFRLRSDGPASFLLGANRQWSYFLISFLLKTPLLTLVLLAIFVFTTAARRPGRSSAICILPPLFFLAVALLFQVNSGYRYILSVLPFFLVCAGGVATSVEKWLQYKGAWANNLSTYGLFFAALGWYVFGTASVYPYYVAYFNEIAGGPDNGWQILVGDDLDRGQGLGDLKRWLDQRGVSQVKLAYQGAADPAYYGIDFELLPGPFDDWESRYSFYPDEPSPGTYAISVNSLQGLRLSDPDTFAWFRQRQPLAKIGYAIFIYEVPRASAHRVVVSLSGLRAKDIVSQDYHALFRTNDVQFKWFRADRAFVFPTQPASLYYLISGPEIEGPPLQDGAWTLLWRPSDVQDLITRHNIPYTATSVTLPAVQVADVVLAQHESTPLWWSSAVTFLPGDPAAHAERLVLPVQFGDRVELLGYVTDGDWSERGTAWQLVTWWRVARTDPAPLKVFVHLIDNKSTLVGGDDRLDVATDGWQSGDVFYQVHRLAVGDDVIPGVYQVELGWYDARTIQRLDVYVDDFAVADRVLLVPVEIVAGEAEE